MEIKALSGTDFETLFEAFSKAFADYEMQLDREELRAMLIRRGFDPQMSFGAFDGNRLVSFTFNGIGYQGGILTAYDTGTGTVPGFRGKGLASSVFEFSLPHLAKAGVRQYVLEVLQHNRQAISVYRKMGFQTVRELNYFRQESTRVINDVRADTPLSVGQITLKNFPFIPDFWDFEPSWQNSMDSIERASGNFICLGSFLDKELAGYCVFQPASGDIAQLAVGKPHRRKGIGSILLREMCRRNRNGTLKAINTDTRCRSITDFLESKNIPKRGCQFEMIRRIDGH